MFHTYWPIIIPIALGCVFVLFATKAVRNGITYDDIGFTERGKNPIQFWLTVAIMYLAGAFSFAMAFYVYLVGGMRN